MRRYLWVGVLVFVGCGDAPEPRPCDRSLLLDIELETGAVTELPGIDALGQPQQAGAETWVRSFEGLRQLDADRTLSVPLLPNFERFALADIDGDGDFDVAGADGDTIRLYERTGPLALRGRGSIDTFAPVNQITPGDLDGDGDVDLVFGGARTLLGDGAFGFQVTTQRPVEDGSVFRQLADIDGDDILDLVTVENTQGVSLSTMIRVYLGTGDGLFAEPLESQRDRTSGLAARVADFDGDGLVDIAARSDADPAAILLASGRGDGTFAPFVDLDVAAEYVGFDKFRSFIPVRDVDGDGVSELIFTNRGDVTIASLIPGRAGPIRAVALPIAPGAAFESIDVEYSVRATGDRAPELLVRVDSRCLDEVR